ncbi:hypothetical protein TKK_0011339 [Trichogramma kaykai]|uniref:CUB domain-containing protein n=1 Tax=Trichogramma kaykai TaxID=54128 RepID=A0ABD2WTG6_9HYME
MPLPPPPPIRRTRHVSAAAPLQPPLQLLLLLLLLASTSDTAKWGSGPSITGSHGQREAVSFIEPESNAASTLVRSTPETKSTSLPDRESPPFLLQFDKFYQRHSDDTFETSYTAKSDTDPVTWSIAKALRRMRREDQGTCYKFEEGEPLKQEFYSPNYPDVYPKNMSCFKVLEADPGMVLRVEFRDNFELEDQEKCIYDFLEVRDGKYGYSRLIGRFCRAFPFPEITSSSRYLWLHFRSDNSIQGAGFRAVWSMIPRPSVKTPESEECVLNVTNQMEYEIKTSEIADRKKIAVEQGTELDCIWNITVPEGWKIQITFPQFHLDKPNECDINYVQVYDKEPSMINNPSLINNFCGSIADLVTSKGNEAYLRFFATKAAMNSSFEATMTAIREKENKDKACADDEFDCQDACIADTLRCNGRPNCRYRFDEDADVCSTEKTGFNVNSEHVIIILVVFSILMLGLCCTFCYNCVRKLIKDHKIIKETIRQSRENRLDELGRKSTPCSMVEPCMEVRGGERARSSETPSLDGQAANSRDGQGRASMARQPSLGHSLDLSDIHQSNNVSNATQERRSKVVGSRETRDMECQTRESIFESGLVLKPIAHPVFTTFGFNNSAEPQRSSMERGADSTSRRDGPESPRAYKLASREPSPVAAVPPPPPPPPTSYQCPVYDPPTELCFRHSLTPIVPAPHGWSAHESNYSSDELASLQRAATAESPGPASISSGSESATAGPPSTVFGLVRQRTLGSGEHYGFIYGRDGSTVERGSLSTSASGSHRSGLVKPVKCPQVTDSQFKTEAVIEIDQRQQRPFSIESTKSAPDVIATH